MSSSASASPSPSPSPILCTRHPDGTAPIAKYACLSCSRYLCHKCDVAVHTKEKHYRFPVAQLKSFIVFDPAPAAGESHARRHLAAQSGPIFKPVNGATSLFHAFQHSVTTHPNNSCLGHRTVDASTGKVGPFQYETYKQVGERVKNFGAGLKNLGLAEKARVGLYSVNRPEWVIAEYGSFSQALHTVPLYDTFGPDAAEFVIKQATVNTVVCSADKVASLIDISQRVPELKHIIVMPNQPFDTKEMKVTIPSVPATATVKVWTFQEIEKKGAAKPVPYNLPTVTDIATLCYTSGTTGNPKGAVLTHGNILADAAAARYSGVDPRPDDVHISYLPLAHMFERLVQATMLGVGAAIGFSRGNPLILLEDIEECKPTIFAGVPRLYNRLYDKISSTIDASGGIKKWLFHKAYASKQYHLQNSGTLDGGLWDKLVFSKIAARLGGRVRLMVTGSAPISDSVMTFLRVCFSCPVQEGYGQTEGTAATTIVLSQNSNNTLGNVGIPLICNDVKLVDVPEMNYTGTDVINGIPTPRGEICVRGHNVFQGYYLDAEKTAETLDSAGWLHSGDIGQWLPDGSLKIIDRKKNIFKLSQGEYIAPEKIENVYQRSKFVAQIFVYGDSLQSQLVAVVVPDEEELAAFATRNRMTGSFKDLAANPGVQAMILKDMNQVATDAQLRGFEQVRQIHVSPELFSVQNELLTPSFKLKRDQAKKKFAKEISSMYQKIEKMEAELKASAKKAGDKIKSAL